jgi:hypothetical protein
MTHGAPAARKDRSKRTGRSNTLARCGHGRRVLELQGKEDDMKRAIIAILAIVIGWWEFQDDPAYWLPAWGTAIESGYGWGQVAILALLTAIIFGTVVWTGYRALGYLLD